MRCLGDPIAGYLSSALDMIQATTHTSTTGAKTVPDAATIAAWPAT
jgi:hypothetical protein